MTLTKTGVTQRAAARQPKLPWYAPYGDDMAIRYGGLAFLAVGLIFLTIAFSLHRADSRRTARAVGTVPRAGRRSASSTIRRTRRMRP